MYFVIYERAILAQSEDLAECQKIAASQARACVSMKPPPTVYVAESIREISATVTITGIDSTGDGV